MGCSGGVALRTRYRPAPQTSCVAAPVRHECSGGTRAPQGGREHAERSSGIALSLLAAPASRDGRARLLAVDAPASDAAAPAGRDVRGRLVMASDVPASDEDYPAGRDGRGRQVTAVVPASVVAAPSGHDSRGRLLPLGPASDEIDPGGRLTRLAHGRQQKVEDSALSRCCALSWAVGGLVRIVLVGNSATSTAQVGIDVADRLVEVGALVSCRLIDRARNVGDVL